MIYAHNVIVLLVGLQTGDVVQEVGIGVGYVVRKENGIEIVLESIFEGKRAQGLENRLSLVETAIASEPLRIESSLLTPAVLVLIFVNHIFTTTMPAEARSLMKPH